ncbi:uncharacterized protein LOC116250333 [Nymphaea colorata]|nr:uncharacterized protein LOC116250333 [Nymphaea colorata]
MEVHPRRRHGIIRVLLIICSFFFVVVGVVLINQAHIQEIMKEGDGAFSRSTAANNSSDFHFSNATITHQTDPTPTIPAPSFRLLIGVFTDPRNYLHRNFLRLVYGTQRPEISVIDVKFVFCNLTDEEQQVFVAVEIMRFDDIIILNCNEKEDGGKTYSYLSSMPNMFDSPPGSRPTPYDYVMKVNDDTFVHIGGLEVSMKSMAREDMYCGFQSACQKMDQARSPSMAYVLSWDLTKLVGGSSYAKAHQVGLQQLFAGDDGQREGRRAAKNRYSGKAYMYDSHGTHACGHELNPNTIAIYGLKDERKWIQALTYFNMTSNLKPSKFYHIP